MLLVRWLTWNYLLNGLRSTSNRTFQVYGLMWLTSARPRFSLHLVSLAGFAIIDSIRTPDCNQVTSGFCFGAFCWRAELKIKKECCLNLSLSVLTFFFSLIATTPSSGNSFHLSAPHGLIYVCFSSSLPSNLLKSTVCPVLHSVSYVAPSAHSITPPTKPMWTSSSPYLKPLCAPSFLFLAFLFPLPSCLFPPPLLHPVLFLSPPPSPASLIVSPPLWVPFPRARPSPRSYPSRLPPSPTNHLSPLPSSALPLFPAARAPLPPSSPQTPRRRAPAPAQETEASSAR